MALQAFLDKYLLPLCSMESTQVNKDTVQPPNSDNLVQKGQLEAAAGSCSNASSGNSPGSLIKIPDLNVGAASEGRNPTSFNSKTNLESSLEASSIGFLAGSAVLKGVKIHRGATTDMDHIDLPTFTSLVSPNLSISRCSTTHDSLIAQKDSHTGQDSSQFQKRKLQQGGLGTASQSELQNSLNLLLDAKKQRLPASTQIHKKPRLDNMQHAILQENIIHQLLQSQDYVQQEGQSPSRRAAIPQCKLGNQKQQNTLQSTLRLPQVSMKQQRPMRDYNRQLPLSQVQCAHPFKGTVCSRRLMQYLYHLRQRPRDNGIAYWRKFVAEYYAPCAKKRWCLSSCDSVKLHAMGVFSQATMDTWHCDLCGTKSGRGFEATFEVLPRLSKIQFDSGIVDEFLYLESPLEFRLPSGLMMLEYRKAVHKTVYDQLHVVREGKLRVVFAHNLKMLCWEFCSRNNEELLPRRLILSQVNELVLASKKYQTTSDSLPPCDLQENCNTLLSTALKLQRNLDLQPVGDSGFSKRYIRCLQMADIFNSMNDLMTFSWDNKIGPIESLKKYSQKFSAAKPQKNKLEEPEQLEIPQWRPADANKKSSSRGLSTNSNDNANMSTGRLSNSPGEAAWMLPGSCQTLPRQTSINLNVGELGQPLYGRSNRSASATPSEGHKTLSTEFIHNLTSSSFHSSEGSQRTIQKLLQEMIIRAENEAVNCKIDDILAALQTNSKAMDTRTNRATIESNKLAAATGNASGGVIAEASGSIAVSDRDSSKVFENPSLIKREPAFS